MVMADKGMNFQMMSSLLDGMVPKVLQLDIKLCNIRESLAEMFCK